METVTEPSWDPHGDLHGILAGTFMESCHEGFSNLHGTFIGSFMETFCGSSWDLRENVQNRSKLNLSLPFVLQYQGVKGRLIFFHEGSNCVEPSWKTHGDLHGILLGACLGPSWNLRTNLHGNPQGTFMEAS